jgi:hypothetical protein
VALTTAALRRGALLTTDYRQRCYHAAKRRDDVAMIAEEIVAARVIDRAFRPFDPSVHLQSSVQSYDTGGHRVVQPDGSVVQDDVDAETVGVLMYAGTRENTVMMEWTSLSAPFSECVWEDLNYEKNTPKKKRKKMFRGCARV